MIHAQRSRVAATALVALAVAASAVAGPPVAQPVPARHSADASFARLEHEYVTYMLERFPVVATYLGGAQFDPHLAEIDGRLRDYSATALQQEDAALSALRARFVALAPARLSPRRRIDRSVALAQIAFLIHEHQVRRLQRRALDSYVDEPVRGVDWQLQGMTATGDGHYGTDGEWQLVIARTRAVPAYLASAAQQLRAGVAAHDAPDWRMLVGHGLRSTASAAEYFADTLPQLGAANITAPRRAELLRALQTAGAEAAAAYRQLRAFVAATYFEQVPEAGEPLLREPYRADHFALGDSEYAWALHNNLRLSGSAVELYRASWPVAESTRAELLALAQQIAAEHGWPHGADGAQTVRAVFAQLAADAPRTDAEMMEGYRRTGARLVAYARATGLFDVPADYRLDVVATPPPLRASIEGGAYYPAPPFKAAGVGRFYITPTGDDATALRTGHNFASMPDLAGHEGFPGHDWHFKVMTRYRAQISPLRWLTPGAVEDSSSMWEDSMAVEGWGLYSEALLAEAARGAPHGLYSPEERLYQLRGKLYRDVRVRIDTGIHTGRLSFEDAVTLFSASVDFLPGACTDTQALQLDAKATSCRAARGAVTRYSRWPTQAITYRLGKEQILALRRRAQQALGAHFSAQRFHLEFMKQGTIPPGYFGDELLRTLRGP